MIKVGTLCYINSKAESNLECVGNVVTVLSDLVLRGDGVMRHQITRPPSLSANTPPPYFSRPHYLTPISDPDQSQDVRHDETLTA